MDIEEAFKFAGNLGRFQFIVTVINYYANMLYGSQQFIMVIAGATPDLNIPSEANLTTIITEWNLYDETWITSLMASLFLAGYTAGSLIFGQLPDLYGRKPVLVIGLFLATVCCFCSAFCQNWHTFAVTRFLGGVFAGGAVAPAFVLTCELVGKDLWASVGMMYQIFFSSGIMLVGLLGYWLKDWRKLMMVSSGLCALVLPFIIFVVPESPRWLYSVGKIEKAERVIKLIIKRNGKDESGIKLIMREGDTTAEDFQKHSLIDLFKIKKLTIILMAATYVGFACAMAYYGLTIDAGDLMPNLYLAIVLSGAVEIPANIITLFLMNSKWFGRNGTLVALFLLASITSTCILFTGGKVSLSAATTTLGLTSKLSVAAAFSVIFIYISELFPTQLRTVAVAFSNIFARIAEIIASFVPLLGNTAFFLPYLIFGAITLVAGAVTIILPETLGQKVLTMSDFDTSAPEHQLNVDKDERPDEAPINDNERAHLLQ